MLLISFVPINMVRQCRDRVASTSASPRAHATPAVYGLNLSTQKEKASLVSLEYYCSTALSQGVGRGREGITFFMMHDMEEWMRNLDGNGPHPAAFSTHRNNNLVQGVRAQLPKYAQLA